MKFTKLFLVYFIAIVYSLEILLFFFSSNEKKSMVNIKNTRIELAKKKNLDFDIRSPEKAFLDFKKKKNLKPVFYFNKTFKDFKTFKNAEKNKEIIPFRGPLNELSLSCAEDLKYKLIINDKYGFKNLNSIYENKINVMLLGDSYAEGLCEKNSNDIAGHLNKKNINTANFGVTGSGPLVSLAIIKEFINNIKPSNVVYLYFEGNDLQDLNWEKNNNYLSNYLNEGYQNEYVKKIDKIKRFLNLANIESNKYLSNNLSNNSKIDNLKLNYFREHIKDLLELNNLRNIIKFSILNVDKNKYDLKLFYKIVFDMKKQANSINANYIFVYVPSWTRYFAKNTKESSMIKKKSEILKNLKNKNITTIDLTEYFDNRNDIREFFPLGYLGHYNSAGYKRISEIIAKKLK